MSGQLGHGISELDDLARMRATVGKTNLDDLIRYLIGGSGKHPMQRQAVKDVFTLAKKVPGVGGKAAATAGRFAGRLVPGISAIGNVTDVADIIAGGDSFGNKAMDAVAMGLGGTAGFFLGGGPLGASIGASVGKAASDGTQFLFGDRKSAEQRKLEEALMILENASPGVNVGGALAGSVGGLPGAILGGMR